MAHMPVWHRRRPRGANFCAKICPPLAGAALGLGTGVAVGEPWACQFTAECIAGDPCLETDWQVEIIAADHEGQLFVSSVSGDAPVTRMTEPDTVPAVYAGTDQLVTVAPDGAAMLTAHQGYAITYFGACEVLQ